MTLMEWIKLDVDNLPEVGEQVLIVVAKKGEAKIALQAERFDTIKYEPWTWAFTNGHEDFLSCDVSHWMPMPEPPKEKLKPCPFCGCEEPTTKIDQWDKWTVYCTNCSATIDDFYTEEGAIRAWNTRAGAENE